MTGYDPALQAFVQSVRDSLEIEFLPRSERAKDLWRVTISETLIAGLPCQVVRPPDVNPSSTLLYLFGGGYISGSPDYELPITAALAVQADVTVIAPRYPLAPEHPIPRTLDRVTDLWEELSATSDDLSLAGESAGGGLALSLVHACADRALALPRSLTLFSPWTDLTEAGVAATRVQDDPTVNSDELGQMARAALLGFDANHPSASPGLAPFAPNWPATYLSTGQRDILRPGVLALYEKLCKSGHVCHLHDAKDMWHVFELYDETDKAADSLIKAAAFIKDQSA